MKIICNPTSYNGRARKNWPKYVKAFKENGLDFEVEWTKGVDDAIKIVKESVKDHKIIAAYGGDGTVNEVITGLGQTGFKNTLALIPQGRGNDNAFTLHITNKLQDVVQMLVRKEERKVDCIEVNDGSRYVVGVVGAGISGAVAYASLGAKTPFTYTKQLIKNIFTYKPDLMKVTIDDGEIIREGLMLDVAVGNGICAGNKKILCPDAIIDDGLIDITIVGNVKLLQKLIILGKLDKGTHVKHKAVEQLLGKKVVLENVSDHDIPRHFMGEKHGEFPYTFVMKPKALTVLKMPDHVLKRENWL
ncbi:MAG: diacylglycerol/lipid kinase family protein [Candidatus Heimdallarchaeota archaeon]